MESRRCGTRLLLGVFAVAVACGGERWEDVEGRGYDFHNSDPSGSVLVWYSVGCYGDYRIMLDETPDAVRIVGERRGERLGDCEGAVVVELAAPLGDRRVFDGRTSAELLLQP